jgi:hypothetical protein
VINRGRVVSTDDLIEHVWRGRIVSDGAQDRASRVAESQPGGQLPRALP